MAAACYITLSALSVRSIHSVRPAPICLHQTGAVGYAVAVLAPVATTALRLWAGDWLIGVPFILLFPSVTLAAFLGGFGPGLLALAVSMLLSVFVLIEPREVSGAQGVRCSFAMPGDLVLPESHRQPVALMVSELATNAQKHAFGPKHRGALEFRFAEIEPGQAELTYTDDGAPFPADFTLERSARSGLKLVDALARQFGGTLAIECGRPKTIVIRFPLV